MTQTEKQLSEKESLDLIATMINKAKDSYHNTGISAIMWGSLITICALVKLSEIHFNYRLPFDIYLLTILAVIPQIFISIKEKKSRRVKSYDDAYMDYIWLAFGVCIFLMIFIVNTVFAELGPVMTDYKVLAQGRTAWIDFKFSEYVAPLFLLLYGIPTFITGAACRFKPMLWGGLLCWASCILALFTTIKIDLLLTAISAIFAWLIPGIIMEVDYRKAKKELAEANV
ncbi:hypothetical protein CAP36_17110 [Chitinophagaceae bacterium IBVUCB2]|nr:hypothetical protein CAP36_17110 [Chitinophagaceae bacterium IBVUCB2]